MEIRATAQTEITISKATAQMVRQLIPLIPASAILFPDSGDKYYNEF